MSLTESPPQKDWTVTEMDVEVDVEGVDKTQEEPTA